MTKTNKNSNPNFIELDHAHGHGIFTSTVKIPRDVAIESLRAALYRQARAKDSKELANMASMHFEAKLSGLAREGTKMALNQYVLKLKSMNRGNLEEEYVESAVRHISHGASALEISMAAVNYFASDLSKPRTNPENAVAMTAALRKYPSEEEQR